MHAAPCRADRHTSFVRVRQQRDTGLMSVPAAGAAVVHEACGGDATHVTSKAVAVCWYLETQLLGRGLQQRTIMLSNSNCESHLLPPPLLPEGLYLFVSDQYQSRV